MKTVLESKMREFVRDYPATHGTKSAWGEPLIAYADASNPEFSDLKKAVSPSHAMPSDILPGAKSVVVYFLPFQESIPKSNVLGRLSSPEWAIAYIETNRLITDLNSFVKVELEEAGYRTNVTPATHNFDPTILKSDWSHRHVAVIAGLGTLGLNNMLITDKGCCGRIGSFVTEGSFEPTVRKEGENCLYKSSNLCKKCVDRCVNGALSVDSFNRYKCYEMCLENDRHHSQLELSDVCGKCLVHIPCATRNPQVRKKV